MRLQPVGIHNNAPINRNDNYVVKKNKLTNIPQANIVNFKGRADQVIFYGAEFPDYNKKGGVANVMGYYEKLPGVESVIVQTYYNGQKNYNKKGEYTGEVKPWQFNEACKYDGLKNQYFYIKFNTDKKNIIKETTTNLDSNIASKDIIILKKIAEKNVVYGSQQEQQIILFKAMAAIPIKNEKDEIVDYKLEELPKDQNTGKNRNHFFIYSKGTAEFKEPYDDGSYNSDKTQNPDAFSKFKPQPYAENNRAFVELKQALCDAVVTTDGSKFEPSTVVCSDTQTAYTISYMRDEAVNGNPAFNPQEIAPAYVIHNLRAGYTGECGGLDIALNLGLSSDEIEIMKKDPEYISADEAGNPDAYFTEYIPELRDGSGAFNPTLIAFKLRQSGYMTGLNTVSPGYARDIAYNTNLPTSLQNIWRDLYDNKQAIGIMNPFEDPSFHMFKGVIGMNGYLEKGVNETKNKLTNMGEEFAALADELHPFEKVDEAKFPKQENGNYTVTEEAYNHYIDVKNTNKKEFLNRLTPKFDILISKDKDLYNTIIAGKPNWNVNLIGKIDENLLVPDRIDKLKVYVSWGRLDSQKSLDIVMDAFDKYCTAHPEEAENCILVLGGEAPGTEYSDKTLEQANKMAAKYQGHFCFMEAFAPGKILASVAEMALLPSREAPCELTDLETMQFMTLLTATNTQGMADKNFDPEIDGEDIATSFKTKSGYYISSEDIKNFKELGIGKQWENDLAELTNKVETEKINRAACSFNVDKEESDSLQDYINANPDYKKAFDDLLDKYRSLILTAGVVTCIERGVNLTKQQRMKMAENELNLKTGWENNQQLTKAGGKSSADLYRDIFKAKADTDTGKYGTSFLHKLREHLNTLKNRPKETITPPAKSFLGKYGKVISWATASAVVTGSAVYYFMSKSQNNTGMRTRKHPDAKQVLKKHSQHKMNIKA